MKVDTRNKNKALESLFADPAQIVFWMPTSLYRQIEAN